MFHLGPDPQLVSAAAMVARIGGDDHLVGHASHEVDQSLDPLAGPSARSQGSELGQLGGVVVDVTRDEIATQPQDDPTHRDEATLMLNKRGNPLGQFLNPSVCHIEAVVVETVDRVGIDTLFDVPIAQGDDDRRLVTLALL